MFIKQAVSFFVCLAMLVWLQACSAYGIKQPSEAEKRFSQTHVSMEVRRVDDVDIGIVILNESKEQLVTLEKKEAKNIWLPADTKKLFISKNLSASILDENLFHTIDLDMVAGRHYVLKLGISSEFEDTRYLQRDVDKMQAKRAQTPAEKSGLTIDSALGFAAKVGLMLGVVIFAIATGSSGSIIMPTPEFFRGKRDKAKADEEESK